MKVYRVYFNRKSEAPQVWSIDEGTQESEINVRGFSTSECPIYSYYNGQPANEDVPVAWIEVWASNYVIADGIVCFYQE